MQSLLISGRQLARVVRTAEIKVSSKSGNEGLVRLTRHGNQICTGKSVAVESKLEGFWPVRERQEQPTLVLIPTAKIVGRAPAAVSEAIRESANHVRKSGGHETEYASEITSEMDDDRLIWHHTCSQIHEWKDFWNVRTNNLPETEAESAIVTPTLALNAIVPPLPSGHQSSTESKKVVDLRQLGRRLRRRVEGLDALPKLTRASRRSIQTPTKQPKKGHSILKRVRGPGPSAFGGTRRAGGRWELVGSRSRASGGGMVLLYERMSGRGQGNRDVREIDEATCNETRWTMYTLRCTAGSGTRYDRGASRTRSDTVVDWRAGVLGGTRRAPKNVLGLTALDIRERGQEPPTLALTAVKG
ncbi:hypothetical protein B0H12DRAFT_1082923 [Mycena haematopus]|nr:hypothetical protein B0H12DRAFT_1082923 [Mycena haematopus]